MNQEVNKIYRDPSQFLSIHLSDLCNNRCIFCIVDAPSKKRELVSSLLINAFLKDNKNGRYRLVNLHGGEATVRKDFFELLELIKKYNYAGVILQTNARRLADKNFAARTVHNGVGYCVVSVHGKDEHTHDGITRTPNSFKQTIEGIRNIKNLGGIVRTNTVVCKQNLEQLSAIVDLLADCQVDHINLSALHTDGTVAKNFNTVTPRYTDVKESLNLALRKIISMKIRLTIEGFPYCILPGFENYRVEEKVKMLYRTRIIEDYMSYMNIENRIKGEPCIGCKSEMQCGGVYKNYIEHFGWSEFGYENMDL